MEYGNYYTEETLRSLNAAYDTLYGITSRETEKVNGIIRRMEKAGRFPPVTRTAGRRPARILSAKRGLLPAGTYRNDKERAGDGLPCVPCAVLPHEKQKGVLQHRRRSVDTGAVRGHDTGRTCHKMFPDMGTQRKVPERGGVFPYGRTLMDLPRTESPVR